MRNVTPITEHFQHFLADLKETFWGDGYGKAKGVVQGFLEEESARLRDPDGRCEPHGPGGSYRSRTDGSVSRRRSRGL